MRRYKKWLPIEDELLRHLHEKRKSLKETAEQLCRTIEAIHRRKMVLGLKKIVYQDIGHAKQRERLRKSRMRKAGLI